MKKLYRFCWDCGRAGRVEGTFVAEETKIAEAMGRNIDFGSCLGKHSEVYGTLDEQDLTVLTDDQAFIAKWEHFLPKDAGRNPLNYVSDNQ